MLVEICQQRVLSPFLTRSKLDRVFRTWWLYASMKRRSILNWWLYAQLSGLASGSRCSRWLLAHSDPMPIQLCLVKVDVAHNVKPWKTNENWSGPEMNLFYKGARVIQYYVLWAQGCTFLLNLTAWLACCNKTEVQGHGLYIDIQLLNPASATLNPVMDIFLGQISTEENVTLLQGHATAKPRNFWSPS